MTLQINPKKPENSFKEIAGQLINYYNFQVNQTNLELCDLEFYWNDEKDHEDKSTHSHEYLQGQLRPHGAGYDIALRDENGYGGILIRGIMKDSIPTYGPIRSADIIFQAGANLLEEGFQIKLVKKSTSTEHPVFATPRIGLKEDGKFWDKNYRFVRCSADYLCEVDGKTKLCAEIGKSEVKVNPEILDEALRRPRKRHEACN